MKKEQIKKASEFLGLKKITPLENQRIRGGIQPVHDKTSCHHHEDRHPESHHLA